MSKSRPNRSRPKRKRRNQSSRSRPPTSSRAPLVFVIVSVIAVVGIVLALVFGATGGGNSDEPKSDPKSLVGFDAAVAFAIRCAGCHGRGGTGGSAPRLSGGAVVAKYPNIDDQIDVVTNG